VVFSGWINVSELQVYFSALNTACWVTGRAYPESFSSRTNGRKLRGTGQHKSLENGSGVS